jgi:diguanylate cyclase (GGDEF)-like protein
MIVPDRWIQRIIHITPTVTVYLASISLTMNMASSVSQSPMHLVVALIMGVMMLCSILSKQPVLKYVFCAVAFAMFLVAIPELSFYRLISTMYIILIFLSFELPSPYPPIIAGSYFLYLIPTYENVIPQDLIYPMMMGIVVNTILYVLLSFYLRSLVRENRSNKQLNKELNAAMGQLEQMAYYDTLTGLPNREKLKMQMKEELSKDGQKLAVLFLDVDRFKNVNDLMGHAAGDTMLQDIGERLCHTIGDRCFISRYAGDEFLLLYPYHDHDQLRSLADEIVDSFRKPYLVNHNQIYTTPSIGISLFPEDATNEDNLIQFADKAMYEVKSNEKNGYRFFSDIKSDELLRQVKLENDLRRGLEKNEFFIHYQPLVEIHTGEIKGVEALLRWMHPELGLIPPDEFIPLAERNGEIVPLGKWVLRESCKQVKLWHLSGHPEFTLAVNISIRQFKDSEFPTYMSQILQESSFDPTKLELEVTESMMQNVSESVAFLNRLKQEGVKISIDDFGTGYSSLSMLRQLPVDYLKIDRSFTNELTAVSSNESIVKMIIDIGQSMNMKVVCEGIETEQQLAMLKVYGCEIGQGYYYHRPSSAEDIEKLIYI